MIIRVCANPEALGAAAARQTAQLLRDAIAECGTARIVLSTGASQFATIDHLSREDVDWSRVEMFHLDEYIGLPENHRASFQKYLQERFVDKVRGIKPHYVTGDPVHAAKVGALLQSGPDRGSGACRQSRRPAAKRPDPCGLDWYRPKYPYRL